MQKEADVINEFIRFAIQKGVLKFGDFTLKSGRQSPYFFNAGLFQDGESLARLGQYYAQALQASGVDFEVLFGPAYKGIPLVSATAISLSTHFHRNVSYAYSRKEAKQHGEGGQLVGAELSGKVIIVDDIITAGTAIREAIDLIQEHGAELAGVVVAIDRQEKGNGSHSAIEEVQQEFQVPVISIVKFSDIIEFVSTQFSQDQMERMQAYRLAYGVS
ncbi:MAG: orotate phosphoribosyltransferase [Gammaproteobacteria bacterium]|jgi:orotate phosphoribosyltransferase|nr:orotate phosphoribosyltransferase [Gammaproteobacteria bacterium]MBT5203637.1 orotate phosphoribosyltransferase [Gammaproteobacteria bacterium]MBT5602558.1 orotate phosphoribosyltransferase [Gammaproteobacteria bacterium]MBT6245853.1 orotate phosphoribosyltransferase [Gammaproteobacteria bacterium]